MEIVNSIVPVFFVIGLGVCLCKSGFLEGEFLKGLNRLVYWVGLPCLLFFKAATASEIGGAAWRAFIVVFLGTCAIIVLSLAAGLIFKVPKRSLGTFVQVSFRGNLAYIGLPIVIFSSLSSLNPAGQSSETIAILVLSAIVPFYNVVAVVALLASQHEIGRDLPSKMFGQLVKNPLLLSCLLGLLYGRTGIGLHPLFSRTLSGISQMCLPLALLSIGGALVTTKISGKVFHSVLSAFLKVFAAPFAGYIIGSMMGIERQEMRVAVLLLACPTAVSAYVLTERLEGDEAMAANTVVISTLLSMISASIVVALT